jgi:drug/metabolite transporter (DMT)-like permease
MKLRAGLYPGLGLLLLSMLSAFGWLLPDLFPVSGTIAVSLPLGQAILFAVFAAMTTSIAVVRRLEFPRGRSAWVYASLGLGFFVIPTSVAAFARNSVSSFDAVGILCLTPIFAVVLEPYLQGCPPRSAKAALAGALFAIAGILSFVPFETPSSFRAGAALFFLLITAFELAATNCVAVRLASTAPGGSTLPMAALAGSAAAICFALIAAISRRSVWPSSALQLYLLKLFLVDLPGLLLLFGLMKCLAASRMAARFLLVPMFAALAGLAMEQALPPPRVLVGIVLLAGGSGWLVFAPGESEVEELITLKAAVAELSDGTKTGSQ